MTLDAFLARFSGLPHGSLWALVIATLAGVVASAVCPCTVPVGLGVAGMAGSAGGRDGRASRAIAVTFFAGMVVNLAILGAVAGRLGAMLTGAFGRDWALSMAVVSFVAAGTAFSLPRLDSERLASWRRTGLAATFVYGFVFSLGTSAAPLLLLLTVATAQARPQYGFLLALAFGVGRGFPFLLAGWFGGALMRFARLRAWARAVQIASGAALLLVGVYYARAFTVLS